LRDKSLLRKRRWPLASVFLSSPCLRPPSRAGTDPCRSQPSVKSVRSIPAKFPQSQGEGILSLRVGQFCCCKSELRPNNDSDARIHGRCSEMGERSAFTIGACWTLALPFLARISIASSNDLHVPTAEPSLEAKKDGPSQRIRPSGPRYTKRALLPMWLAPLMNLFSSLHGMNFSF
jgi:hypothetical protein